MRERALCACREVTGGIVTGGNVLGGDRDEECG